MCRSICTYVPAGYDRVQQLVELAMGSSSHASQKWVAKGKNKEQQNAHWALHTSMGRQGVKKKCSLSASIINGQTGCRVWKATPHSYYAAKLVHTRRALPSTIINYYQEPVSGQACNPLDSHWLFHSFLRWRSFTVLGNKVAPIP